MNEVALREKGYMTSKDAGTLLGYTHDYISRLCRQGKMSGIQKGREWFVTKAELDAFKKRHEVELQEKKIILSKKFSQIRLAHEAKKRKEKELNATPVLQKRSSQEYVQVATESSNKKNLKFRLPRELIAIAILALLVIIPNAFNTMSNTEVGFRNPVVNSGTEVSFATVFSFMPYLADGYWEFFNSAGGMFVETYTTFSSIGNGYLTLYLTQGEIIYASIENLDTLGASVLNGYEILGQSFIVGTDNVIQSYSKMFSLDSNSNLLKKN